MSLGFDWPWVSRLPGTWSKLHPGLFLFPQATLIWLSHPLVPKATRVYFRCPSVVHGIEQIIKAAWAGKKFIYLKKNQQPHVQHFLYIKHFLISEVKKPRHIKVEELVLQLVTGKAGAWSWAVIECLHRLPQLRCFTPLRGSLIQPLIRLNELLYKKALNTQSEQYKCQLLLWVCLINGESRSQRSNSGSHT